MAAEVGNTGGLGRSMSMMRSNRLGRDASSDMTPLSHRTFSFAGPRLSGRMGSFRVPKENSASADLAPLGGRKETMKVNFPGFKGMNDEVELEKSNAPLKVKLFKLDAVQGSDRVFNMISQPHDGFRSQLSLMYKMLTRWSNCDFEIGLVDLKKFFDWWDVFKLCLFDFFTLEERVLYSWIESKSGLPKGMHVRERMVEKLDIIVWGQEVDKTRPKFQEAKVIKDVMSVFLEATETFVGKLLNYFGKKERILPAKFKEAVPEARYVRFEKKMVEEMLKTKEGEMMFMIVSSSSKDGEQWRKTTLNFLQRKTQHPKWSQRFAYQESLLS